MNTHHLTNRLTGLLLLGQLATFTAEVFAQGPFGISLTPSRHEVGVCAGVEPELLTSLGYAYWLGPSNSWRTIGVGASLSLPPYQLNQGSGRLNALIAFDWHPAPASEKPAPGWGGRLVFLPFYARNHNEAGTMNGLGLELRLLLLHQGNRWRGGPDVGWQSTLLTHIRHSNQTHNTFNDRYAGAPGETYNLPIDGWYSATAHRFRLGYMGGRPLGHRIRWQFSMGTLVSLQRQGILLSFAHGQIPVYLETMLSVGW